MIALIVITCILSVLVVILGFTTFNLLRKNEKQIDNKGTFSSDDEVGFFFKSIQGIQEILNDFQVKRLK